MPTANIYGSKMIYISSGSPASTFRPGAIVSVDDGYGQSSYNTDEIRAYMSFDIPDAIRRKQILGGTFYVYARSDDPDGLFYYPIDGGYRDNINWNNKPSWHYNPIDLGEKSSFAWKQKYYSGFVVDPSYKTGALQDVLLKGVSFCHDGRGVGQLYTPYSNNKPYVLVEYTDIQLNAYGAPKSGFVDKHKEIKLIVTASPPTHDAIEEPRLQNATIRWRNGESGEWNQLTGQADAAANRVEFVIAPDSVTAESLHWGIVNIVSNDGVTTNSSAVNILSTVDSLSTAVPVSPVNAIVNIDRENSFSWKHVIATGSDSTGYDLQFTTDGVVWQNLINATGPRTSCTIPANTLPDGKLWWRVRTYNGDGLAGEWSEPAALVGQGAPQPPAISSVEAKARPTIRWQSATQIAFSLVISKDDEEIVCTGEVAGTDKKYTSYDYLEDGEYTVRIRIKNRQMFWSDWTAARFAIITEKPERPSLTAQVIDDTVKINASAGAGKLYLFRDGEPVAAMEKEYTDFTPCGRHIYFVRLVVEEQRFSDSEPVVVDVQLRWATLAPASSPQDRLPLILKKDKAQTFDGNMEIMGAEMRCAGRTFPVFEFSGFENEAFTVPVVFDTRDDYQKLLVLAQRHEPVLYRDYRGNRFFCVLRRMSSTQDVWCSEITLELQRVDYWEKIEFDDPEVM